MSRTLTAEQLEEVENSLEAVEETQTDFWDAVNCLENLLGIDLDDNSDFSHYDVETLLQMQEEQRKDKAQWGASIDDSICPGVRPGRPRRHCCNSLCGIYVDETAPPEPHRLHR